MSALILGRESLVLRQALESQVPQARELETTPPATIGAVLGDSNPASSTETHSQKSVQAQISQEPIIESIVHIAEQNEILLANAPAADQTVYTPVEHANKTILASNSVDSVVSERVSPMQPEIRPLLEAEQTLPLNLGQPAGVSEPSSTTPKSAESLRSKLLAQTKTAASAASATPTPTGQRTFSNTISATRPGISPIGVIVTAFLSGIVAILAYAKFFSGNVSSNEQGVRSPSNSSSISDRQRHDRR